MPWPKKPYTTEISSTQWKLTTARADYTCESPVCKQGAANTAQVHPIPKGTRYAYCAYFQAHYCLDCFSRWAPRETVKQLGLTPPPSPLDDLAAKAADVMARTSAGDAIRWREPNRGILSGTVARVNRGDGRRDAYLECEYTGDGYARRFAVYPGQVVEGDESE